MDSNYNTIILEKKYSREYNAGDIFEYDDNDSPCPSRIYPFVGLKIEYIWYQFEFVNLVFERHEWWAACKTKSYSEYLKGWRGQHLQPRRKQIYEW